MHKLFLKLFDLIYENTCLICSEPSKDLMVCINCENNFLERKNNFKKEFNEITVYSWGFYDNELREGILKLKSGKKKLTPYFSEKLFNFYISLEVFNNDFSIISVPSHRKRIKERGYCQSSLIAKELAKKLNRPYCNEFAVRKKDTNYMNDLESVNDRIQNIKNAFKVSKNEPANKNILIVDDILTSGSTIRELARTIHKQHNDLNLVGLTIASGDKYN